MQRSFNTCHIFTHNGVLLLRDLFQFLKLLIFLKSAHTEQKCRNLVYKISFRCHCVGRAEGEASGRRLLFWPVVSEMSTTYKRPAFWRVPDYIHDEEIFERYAGGRRKSSLISSSSRRNSVKKHVHFKDDPPTVNSTLTAIVPASKVSHIKRIYTISTYIFMYIYILGLLWCS